jgi:hypothetical protein
MATTTNYSWTTPDDTALVKDGAAAIRTLGSSIDTTTKNLNPSTTLGDIEYRSSTANTNTRLAIGSTGNILTVAGGVPTWAAPAAGGGMTLISTTTLSGGSTTLSSIPSTYIDLYVVITAFKPSSDGAEMRVEINGDNTANRSLQLGSFQQDSNAYGQNYWKIAQPQDDTTATGIIEIMLPNYKNTTTVKMAKILSVTNNQGSPSSQINYLNNTAVYNQTTAISSLTFFPTGGSFTSGTIQLYGVQ